MSYLRIWHDNSGKGSKASWFLKYIVVHDLQNREKFFFLCNDWLSIYKGGGFIDRILPVCGEKQKKEFKYLLKRETKYKLSDGHLWLSIILKPIQSSFLRIDRLTCCFVLLYMTMLLNIMYYGVATKSSSSPSIDVSFITLTPEQVCKKRIFLNFD